MSDAKLDTRSLGCAPWERRSWAAALPGFIMISFAAHALSFFLFQALYPQKLTIPPQIPQVSLLTPATPESKALLEEMEFDDPARAAEPSRIEPIGLAPLQYHPSFERMRTPARLPASEPRTVSFPPARSPLSTVESVGAAPPASIKPVPKIPTRLLISGGLENRTLTTPFEFAAHSSEALQSTEFLLGVSDRGEVRYVFLQKSSGSATVDRLASSRLAHFSFDNAAAAITWGFATIVWGDDAYQ